MAFTLRLTHSALTDVEWRAHDVIQDLALLEEPRQPKIRCFQHPACLFAGELWERGENTVCESASACQVV